MNTKAIFASALLAALMAGTSAQAQGRAADVYDNAQAAEVVKVSLQTPAADADELPSR